MLSRFGQAQRGLHSGHFNVFRRYASSPAFTEWSKRYDDLVSKNPKLFSNDFVKDQQTLLSKTQTKDNLSKLLGEYDKARQAIDQATGEAVFLNLDVNDLLQSTPNIEQTIVQSKEEAQKKLDQGTKYVTEILAAQASKTSTVEETNLKMIKVADYADAIDYWRARLPDASNDNTALKLPISDAELDHWVEREYFKAPEEVRVQTGTFEEHRQIEENWMAQLDEKLIAKLKKSDSSIDEKKLREFLDITNELFHPFKIDHYTFSNYAKGLFRAALWDSKDRLQSVEKGVQILSNLMADSSDNDTRIIRALYEQYPDTKFSKVAALQLKMTDPLFGARLCDNARARLEEVSFERAVKDVLRDLEIPYIRTERAAIERELATSGADNPAVLQREIRVLDAEAASYDMQVPTLESVLDEQLPKRLWGRDHSQVKTAILNYASGKGSLDDVNKAVDATLNPSGESGSLTDDEILQLSVRYHNARYSDIGYWNLEDFMRECSRTRKEDFILGARRVIKKKLESLGCDSMVIDVIRLIIESDETECGRLRQVLLDFQEIMKQYRGEIDAVITSAQELDDKTFGQIQKALETANPGKKITTTQVVDAGLQAGFVVKAGVQRFDFSLASVIHEGRKAVSA